MKQEQTTQSIYWESDEYTKQIELVKAWRDGKKHSPYIHDTTSTGQLNGYSEDNIQLVLGFNNHLIALGCKKKRLEKVLWQMRKLGHLLGKDFKQASKMDIERILTTLNTTGDYSEATRSDFKKTLKRFYAWLEEDDIRLKKGNGSKEEALKLYKYMKTIKTGYKEKEIDPGSILTEEDIQKVIKQGCSNDYEKAFIKLLFETGCRVGEILGMRNKDVLRKSTHWEIRVTGKTGERIVPIKDSIPYLTRYMDTHQERDNPDATLWISRVNKWKNERLRYAGIRKLISRCFSRAGVNKRHNPHFFRHSRATIDAPLYSEAIQCKLKGWRIASTMPRRYTHIKDKQVEDAFLKARGIASEENKVYPDLPIKCICETENPPDSKYCFRCGKALKLDVALEAEERKNAAIEEAFQIMAKIMTDPALKDQFEKFIADKRK